jgi:hypothetical protein
MTIRTTLTIELSETPVAVERVTRTELAFSAWEFERAERQRPKASNHGALAGPRDNGGRQRMMASARWTRDAAEAHEAPSRRLMKRWL